MKEYYVYILTNHADRLLYIGVTNDLKRKYMSTKTGSVKGLQALTILISLYIMRFVIMLKTRLEGKSS